MSQHTSANLLEARRLGDLGFYKDAAKFYAAAEAEYPVPPLSLFIEVSGFNMEQGLVGVVADRLKSRTDQTDRSKEEPPQLAMFDLLSAFAEACSTVRLAHPLAKAVSVFNEHLRDKAVGEYDKQSAYLAAIYHGICGVIDLVGFSKDDPPPLMSAEHVRAIFDHVVKCSQYKVALKIASCYRSLPGSRSDLSLLEALIECDFNNDLLRAEVFLEYAEALQGQDKAEEASEYLEASDNLYATAGHAYGSLYIRIKRLRKGKPNKRQERIDDLLRIKSELERIENWYGVRKALQALDDINLEAPNDSLSTSLNVELLRLREICRDNLDWVNQRMIIARRWHFTHANIGQSLQALEELYGEMSSMDAPILLTDIVMLLYEINKQIGDSEKADSWLSQQQHLLPRDILILHDLEPFFNCLQATTSPPEPERERLELKKELDATKQIISKTPSFEDRAIEVRRISNIAQTYTMQYRIRNLEQTMSLVHMCVQFIDDCCSMLSSHNGKDLKATALQAQASLKLIEANLLPFTIESMPGKVELFLESSRLQQEAFELYVQIDKWISASIAAAQIANCLQTVWLLQNSPRESEYFHRAVNLYVNAEELSRQVHHITSVRSHTMCLLRLWFKGFQHNISIPFGDASERVTALQMVEKYLGKVEDLTNIERNDLSALKNESSILAKQNLRKQKDSLELYDIAVKVFATVDDNTPLWTWVQKAKARGVSDLLALGINLPRTMSAEINTNTALLQLVEEERRKQSEIETAPADHKFYMSKELEMHRTKMREHPLLSRMLDLREGRPVEVQTLRDLQLVQSSSTAGASETRKVIFVDWFRYGNIFGVLVVREDAIHAVATNFTIDAARDWKQKYLTHDSGQQHPLDDSDIAPLQELSNLIKPLLDLSKEGDLLVFCPTDALHGIPIHAATLDETSRKSMIERNPVVYTSSMTTLSHCVSRELQRNNGHDNLDDGHTREKPTPFLSHSFVAVFEETDGSNMADDSWQAFRDTIYGNTQKIGSKFPESNISVGQDVSPQVLRNAFESDMMYFFGHCNDAFDNILHQALVLAPHGPHQRVVADMSAMKITDAETTTSNSSAFTSGDNTTGNSVAITPAATPEASDSGQTARSDSHHFTVSDIFRSRVQASNVMLIACGSASESNTPGDEPLGIITSLLCAGASSVIGTLWKVQTGPGMDFSRRFYDMLLSEAETVTEVRAGEDQKESANKPRVLIDLAVVLQRVVCKMKRNQDFRVPFQWAPYMLSGSWFVKRG